MVQIGHTYEVDSYSRMHRGCGVTLYQDTMVPTDLPWLKWSKDPTTHRPHTTPAGKIYYSLEGAAEHHLHLAGQFGLN